MPLNPTESTPRVPPVLPEIHAPHELLNNFEPHVTDMTLEGDGIYDFAAFTFASNSCYNASPTDIEVALPPGTDLSIPEYAHVLLHVESVGGFGRMCNMARKPLHWKGNDINIGTGKSHAVFHTVLNRTTVLGSSIVFLPGAGEILFAGRYRTRGPGSGIRS